MQGSIITDMKSLPAFFIHRVHQPNFITRRHVCWKEQGSVARHQWDLNFCSLKFLGKWWFPPSDTAEMGRRLSRGHFTRLKNGISSVAGISHGWKWYFLGRRHFSRLKSALDSVAEPQMSNVGHFRPRQKRESYERFWNSNLSRPHTSMRRSIQTSFVVFNAHTIMAFGRLRG